jgi:hypothetical protein
MRDNTLHDLVAKLRAIKRRTDDRVTVVRTIVDPDRCRDGERIVRGTFQREDKEK